MQATYQGDKPAAFYRGKTYTAGEAVDVDEATAKRLEGHALFSLSTDEVSRPGLTGKSKAELLEIAEAEGVEVDDDMTNKAIRAAIEDAR